MTKFSRLISGGAMCKDKGSDSDTSAPRPCASHWGVCHSRACARGAAAKWDLAERVFSFMLVSNKACH